MLSDNGREIKRPHIDDEEFGEMCFRIYDSTQYNYAINVKWFVPLEGSLGTFEELRGIVRDIDGAGKRFKLVNDGDSQWIHVGDIVAVAKCAGGEKISPQPGVYGN